MYAAAKHFHMLAIVLSVLLFTVRYCLMMANSTLNEKKFLKIAPHVVDTFLLLSGVALIFITGFMPFTEAGSWLTQKLSCVLAYIALGFFTLKYGKNKVFKTFAYFGALGWLVAAANIAMTKTSFLG
ncbi:SirB2 family protein [Photobacterium sanguinicancri]|uniref:Invasion protein n=1 Tax=Photobacterium sanguinicancri TaxID=875932 RepID=A0AAW7Y9S3_9GAMM|nr:SirB2 family protein [Photobacterium sanguinicancri]KXI24082.1 invasion protein [Photobacterium sanguinicancri]MDO6501085.1 SirB2 family protein [Photobacterium sanguinicancri]MDO6545352.1 SirB2 family protein [Photobacterium sanguinicancri]OZS45242.1 invasion protein [Photobacterium sanguinicancri]